MMRKKQLKRYYKTMWSLRKTTKNQFEKALQPSPLEQPKGKR